MKAIELVQTCDNHTGVEIYIDECYIRAYECHHCFLSSEYVDKEVSFWRFHLTKIKIFLESED